MGPPGGGVNRPRSEADEDRFGNPDMAMAERGDEPAPCVGIPPECIVESIARILLPGGKQALARVVLSEPITANRPD